MAACCGAAAGAQPRQQRHDVAPPDCQQAPVFGEHARVLGLAQPAPVELRGAIGAGRAGVEAVGVLALAVLPYAREQLGLEVAEPGKRLARRPFLPHEQQGR